MQPARNPRQVRTGHRHASFRRIPRSSPLMNENGRPAPFFRNRPIPIRNQNKIIERISPAQGFVGISVRRAYHHVVIRVRHVVRPQVTRQNRFRPSHRSRHTIRAIKHSDNAMRPDRRRTITFPLLSRDTAFADGTGNVASLKPHPARGHHQIIRCQSICPDLAAFVAR